MDVRSFYFHPEEDSMKTYKRRVLLTLIGIAALTGCGGGGGNSGNNGSNHNGNGEGAVQPEGEPQGPGTGTGAGSAMILDAGNAQSVTAAVYGAIDFTNVAGQLGAIPAGALIEGAAYRIDLLEFVLAQYRLASTVAMPQAATGARTELTLGPSNGVCLQGGSAHLRLDDLNGDNKLDPGDSFTMNFNQCASQGTTLNGELSSLVRTATGNPSQDAQWSLGLLLSLQDLSFSNALHSGIFDGGFSVDFEDAGSTATADIAGTELKVNGRQDLRLLDFTSSITRTRENYRFEASGGASFDGRTVSYATTTPFSGATNSYPDAGVLRIAGANNSSVTLTAVDNTNAQLSLDANGDGTMDQTIATPWAELHN